MFPQRASNTFFLRKGFTLSPSDLLHQTVSATSRVECQLAPSSFPRRRTIAFNKGGAGRTTSCRMTYVITLSHPLTPNQYPLMMIGRGRVSRWLSSSIIGEGILLTILSSPPRKGRRNLRHSKSCVISAAINQKAGNSLRHAVGRREGK